jgi:hypothetical protein
MKNILLIFMSLIIVSCTKSDDSSGLDFDQNAFETNRRLWTENKISNYTFSQEHYSLSIGSQPVLIGTVKNKELDTIFISPNNTIVSIENMIYFETIDDIFDYIEWSASYYDELINSNNHHMIGAELDIEYDETFHFPTKITYTGHYSEMLVGGLYLGYVFSDFEVN